MSVIAIFVSFVVFALLYWAVTQIAGAFGPPAQVTTIIKVALVAIFVLYLLALFTGRAPSLRVW